MQQPDAGRDAQPKKVQDIIHYIEFAYTEGHPMHELYYDPTVRMIDEYARQVAIRELENVRSDMESRAHAYVSARSAVIEAVNRLKA